MSDNLGPDSDVIERAARAMADDWNPDRDPILTAMFRDYANTLAAAGLFTPAGAAWHTDPPPGWSTFGAHAFMDEVPALEFWGEEYGGDGLPIWERPVQAPDADVDLLRRAAATGEGDDRG